MTAASWRPEYGRASDKNLIKLIRAFEATTQPGSGHPNAALGPMQVTEARVIRQSDGTLAAKYTKPMFEVNSARRRITRVKRNPAASRTSHLLSRRVYDLSYIHADDKGQPYRHKFSAGVHCQLLSDGSVRLFRPDGKPIWKNFED
jgi:hypothetical protein